MTGKTSGAPKPPPIGAAPLGTSALPSGTSASPPSVKSVMGAPGSSATASTAQGTPGKGTGTVKTDKHTGKLIGPKLEESLTTGTNAKGKGKEPAKVQNNGTDKTGKQKGQEKVRLQEELFGATTDSFKFYGSSRPETETDLSDMDTENEELQNNKKRKQAPVLEHQSSDDEGEQAPGAVLVDSLIQQNNETLEKNQELEQMLKNQELKFQLLARAGQIPEAEIANLLLAQ